MLLQRSKFNSRLPPCLRMLCILGTFTVVSPSLFLRASGQIASSQTTSAARGEALFTGIEPLTGHLREHQEAMPPGVIACSNCHAAHDQNAVSGSDAPVLSAKFLNERISRRHGPESGYDETTFCRVLRTSTDPRYVLLNRTMPCYDVSDAQCQSLWRFLQEPDNDANAPNPTDP